MKKALEKHLKREGIKMGKKISSGGIFTSPTYKDELYLMSEFLVPTQPFNKFIEESPYILLDGKKFVKEEDII